MMLKTLTNLIIYDDGDLNDHIDDTCSDIMMLKTLTIFIASFRKQSGRRMRKYGLALPDKQSAGTMIFYQNR